MSRILGRGRYVYGTYPQGANGGGGSGSAAPLSRQRFIDGGTGVVGGNGSASAPFATVADFMAARGNASAADAETNFVGWVTPKINQYVEDVSFPAYASTELRADSFGTFINGSVAWTNVGGAHVPSFAIVAMHNMNVSEGITVTDDSGAPLSVFLFSADESSGTGAGIGGLFDCHDTTKLASVIFENVTLNGGVHAGTTDDSAIVVLANTDVASGNITARLLTANDSSFNGTGISVAASGTAEFSNCSFSSQPSITALNSTTFDGPSWMSFMEAGGTRTFGTIVLVVGGYGGGLVAGAALPTTGTNTNVSLNGTGATAGYTGSGSGNHYQLTGLNADGGSITFKLSGGEKVGDTIAVTKADLAAHAYAVKSNGGTTIATIPSGSRGFVVARYDGTDWVFLEGGSLAA